MLEQAKILGLSALGITDRNSLAGIVRAHEAAKETGVRLVVGCRLDLTDGTSLLIYPTDRAAYSRLCRLLSLGKSRGGKGKCLLDWEGVAAWNRTPGYGPRPEVGIWRLAVTIRPGWLS